MSKRLNRLALCLAFMCSPNAALSQNNDSTADTVEFEFSWPVGLTADLEIRQEILRPHRDIRIEAQQRMVVESHDLGLRVSRLNGDVTSMEATAKGSGESDQMDEHILAFLQASLRANSALVVSRDGRVLAVEGGDHVATLMDDLMQPALDSLAAQGRDLGAFKALYDGLTSEDGINAQIAENWELLVGVWNGASFEEGVVYENTLVEQSPLLPGQSVTMQYEFGFLERVPCFEGSETANCVRVEVRSRPAPESLAGLFEAVEQELARMFPEGDIGIEEFAQENRIVLVAEPSTLVPYYHSSSKSITMTMSSNGEREDGSRLDVTEVFFRYP
jgi:hypothetical protein